VTHDKRYTMIALEIRLNGKRVCIAGAEDLAVLTANVTASGRLGKKTVPARPGESRDVFYHVGGLTARTDPKKDVHLRWKSIAPLKIGDVIQVKILETQNVDPPTSRTSARRKRARK
jgi:hypothetical protein